MANTRAKLHARAHILSHLVVAIGLAATNESLVSYN